jgi:hypothetical protein
MVGTEVDERRGAGFLGGASASTGGMRATGVGDLKTQAGCA